MLADLCCLRAFISNDERRPGTASSRKLNETPKRLGRAAARRHLRSRRLCSCGVALLLLLPANSSVDRPDCMGDCYTLSGLSPGHWTFLLRASISYRQYQTSSVLTIRSYQHAGSVEVSLLTGLPVPDILSIIYSLVCVSQSKMSGRHNLFGAGVA